MKRLVIIISMFLALNVNANQQLSEGEFSALVSEFIELESELFDLEQIVFEDFTTTQSLKVEDIELVEIEEEVEINFNTKDYLPERFNSYKGMNDLDWSTIKLVEIEEEVDLNANNPFPEINIKSNVNALLVSREFKK